MKVWSCGWPKCPHLVVGMGNPIGLRAIGWEVTFGRGAPAIRCPRHYADPVSDSQITRAELDRRLENIRVHAQELQQRLFTQLDRLFLEQKPKRRSRAIAGR